VDDDLVPRATIRSDQGSFPVVLGARGVHLLDNALATSAAALALGLAPDAIAAGLAAPVLSPMRMALTRPPGGTAVLDDTYNANPMSVAAALHSLAALPAARRVAVLGVMAELGDLGPAEHARMGCLAVDLGIEVIAVAAPDYLAGIDPDGAVPAALAADVTEAHRLLADPPHGMPIGPDDAVLAKGSRVAGLERLVALLAGES
jgi:UDP-N-acetylmuramoyl-tripeptide--D-alanyl-D-alanine ligase